MESKKASEKAIAMAKRFMLLHEEMLRFEVEYTANGETTLDESGHVKVHLPENSEAARISRFLKSMEVLAEHGSVHPQELASGASLLGHEIVETQQTAMAVREDVARAERRYRKKHHIAPDQPLTQLQTDKIEHYRTVRQQEYKELRDDADKLIRVQHDLLQILKELGITLRRPPGPASEEIGRS